MKNLPSFVDVQADVMNALTQNKPVVLESTIITHGMPFPDNVEMASAVEDEIRLHGAVPATIAVFDLSEDLTELGKTDVIVVAAGAKAVLDVPKTLEVLETQGVSVVGCGTNTLPAYWTSASDLEATLRLDSAVDIAEFQKVRDELALDVGLLVDNPNPTADEIPSDVFNAYIATAQSEMEAQGILGKSVTPFLLQRIFELSNGDSLKTNIALVKNNARLAADITVAFHA